MVRNHQRRSVGLKLLRQLSPGDRLLPWVKSKQCPDWLERPVWEQIPNEISVREITVTVTVPGFRSQTLILITPWLDSSAFPKQALADLYRRRWMAELFLRDIKISPGLDVLRCQTPTMIHQELWRYLIAYKLIRTLIFRAALPHAVLPLRVSFKGTAATVRPWAPLLAALDPTDDRLYRLQQALRTDLAKDLLPDRPHRTEPRARKRRPKA